MKNKVDLIGLSYGLHIFCLLLIQFIVVKVSARKYITVNEWQYNARSSTFQSFLLNWKYEFLNFETQQDSAY